MKHRTDSIAIGDTVRVGEGGLLWKVLDIQFRVGGFTMAKVTPLGGGSTMTAPVERLRSIGGVR